MMKAKLLILSILFTTTELFCQEVWSDRSRILPDQLRNLPTAIRLSHSPTPVYPEVNKDTVNFPGKYVWKHSTSAASFLKHLTVVNAGSYIWINNKGWISNIKMNEADFSKQFKCKNGRLKKGKNYTFLQNYRHGDERYAGDALWYVIAEDKDGNRYKGIAIVETETTLKQN